jgi:hypothetical protein
MEVVVIWVAYVLTLGSADAQAAVFDTQEQCKAAVAKAQTYKSFTHVSPCMQVTLEPKK